MDYCEERSRKVPVADCCDVLVCGGGPAGVAAAVAAARTGAKTRLLEVHGCLGGIWTAGLLSWVLDGSNKNGILRRIIAVLEKRGVGSRKRAGNFITDPEQMKFLLEEMCLEAGVEVQLLTRVVGARTEKESRITHAITESKSGRQAWKASVFVDTTGDGDLAAFAGCGYDVGKEGTGEVQPLSLIAMLSGIDPEQVAAFNNSLEYTGVSPKIRLLEEMERAGIQPSYAHPALFHVRDDLFLLMSNHEYGIPAADAGQLTQATFAARRELHRTVQALCSLGGVWSGAKLIATGSQIGVREGRRIHGLYAVSREDLFNGARHTDAVCRVTFGIDVHSTGPEKGKTYEKYSGKALPYDIPLRALIARDVKGLMMAGRCISGDFLAHSSYRVTGNAVAMGEAAGVTAALAALSDRLPQELSWQSVKEAQERLEVSCNTLL